MSPSTSIKSLEGEIERPYPLCLVCLSRPPSAVLLPCCHLNLCYICAPALLYRHRPASSSPHQQIESIPEIPSLDSATEITTSTRNTTTITDDVPTPTPTLTPILNITATATADDATIFTTSTTTIGDDALNSIPTINPTATVAPMPSINPTTNNDAQNLTTTTTTSTTPNIEFTPHPPPSEPTQTQMETPPSTRLPWSTILARATANHPKSRRLSNGGYLPPELGLQGSELRGQDILPRPRCSNSLSSSHQEEECQSESKLGFESMISPEDGNGQVILIQNQQNGCGGPRCLVCRAGVQGWLRVYTG
ncbi:hypothetical protein BCR39DRAFT_536369 [Naematelia encephala]|uniref:Uncharacterized protein n=1 Tax=Naematelia encephala TaxID=71784 RepID=A0A1Y2AZX6_9TREE|nr:hypothetical protein BCR39DRAFT_536369 [Naematelia encephala]